MLTATRRTLPLSFLAALAFSALAVVGASPSALAAPASVRPLLFQEIVPPDPPSGLAVTSVTDRQVTLSWSDASGGLAEFEIQRRVLDGDFGTLATASAGTTEWTDASVLPETTYEYRVGAVVDGIPSEYSAAVTATTLPVPPAGLAVSGVTHRQVTLSWSDASGGLAEFEIQRRVLDGVFGTLAAASAGTTEWTDTSVLPETTYEYRVGAVVDGTPSEYSAAVTATTLPAPPPTAPGALRAEALSPTTVSLAWEDRSDEEIEVQVFRGVDGGMPVLVKSLPADSTRWVDAGVGADRSYSYTVRAVGAVGPSAPSAPAVIALPANFSLVVLKGRRMDSRRLAGDSVDATVGCTSPGGDLLPDPRLTGVAFGVGPAGGPALVSIPAGDSGWKERNGVFTWKSPKGSFIRATVVVDTVKGTVRFKGSRLELDAVDAGAVRVWFRCGADAGSVTGPWTEKKSGMLVR